ncbi:MAG: hypothetical protein ABIW33_00795 [Sphingomicrobium sp.]
MKKFDFALIVTTALGVAACNNSNQDQVNNVELNQPSVDMLNEQANEAAMDAAITATADNQVAADVNASASVPETSSDDQEQNVSGM